MNCGWGTGGFKATPGSGHVFAHTIANDSPHPINAPFTIERFRRGRLIGEITTRAGGSSAAAGKRNPIDAMRASGAAEACLGIATVITSAKPHELERGLGSWHAEWFTIPLVFQTAAAAPWQPRGGHRSPRTAEGALGLVAELVGDLLDDDCGGVAGGSRRLDVDVGAGVLERDEHPGARHQERRSQVQQERTRPVPTPAEAEAPAEERLTYTLTEAARRLGISRALAYEAANRGELPVCRIGRRVLIPRAALLRLLEDGPPDSRPA